METQTLRDVVSPVAQLRAWREGDEVLLAQAGAALSPASLYARFLAGTPTLPAAYLRLVAMAPRWRWDAQVAVRDGHLIGWAEFGRMSPDGTEADLAVAVVDAWQRRGIGTALVSSLLPRCRAAGVTVLSAEVAPSNVAARAALRSWFATRSEGMTVTREDGLLRFATVL
jgi:ribosomal protein S18 acetylase RimI-like enzyme